MFFFLSSSQHRQAMACFVFMLIYDFSFAQWKILNYHSKSDSKYKSIAMCSWLIRLCYFLEFPYAKSLVYVVIRLNILMFVADGCVASFRSCSFQFDVLSIILFYITLWFIWHSVQSTEILVHNFGRMSEQSGIINSTIWSNRLGF